MTDSASARLVLSMAILIAMCCPSAAKNPKQDDMSVRADYVARVEQQAIPMRSLRTMGSLWTADAAWGELAADYKASRVNDTIIIQVYEQTTAQSSGDVSTQRTLDTSSGISGLPGRIGVGGVNPLFAAQSSTKLKGQGQTAADSRLRTSLSGQIIAVLANGNLVVEARRQIAMNNQRETMVVRGVLRPGDVRADNTVPSSALSNLEVELKGKGVISDATRAPNPILRRLLWLIGF